MRPKDDDTLSNPHATPAADCLGALRASPDGLSGSEAARRLAQHGPNLLPDVRVRGPVARFLAQFHNVLIYVLIGAAVVTGVLQHWVDTGVILAVVLANAVQFRHRSFGRGAIRPIRTHLVVISPGLQVRECQSSCKRLNGNDR